MPYSTKILFVNKQDKTLSCEVSDFGVRLPNSPFERIYNDSYDLGLTFVSQRTGKTAKFVMTHTEQDGEGDVRWWTFVPTSDTLRSTRELNGWSLQVFND